MQMHDLRTAIFQDQQDYQQSQVLFQCNDDFWVRPEPEQQHLSLKALIQKKQQKQQELHTPNRSKHRNKKS